jgi:hypothetical protein
MMSTDILLVVACAVGLLLFIAMCLAAVYGHGHWKLHASRKWATATGKVLESRAVWETVDENSRIFVPRVIYEYQVGNRPYRNDRIFVVKQGNSDAEATAAQFPVGMQVSVYYDPADPAQAALVRNAPSTALYLGLIALMLTLAAAICGLSWLTSFIAKL